MNELQVDVIYDEFFDSPFRLSSTEEMEYKLDGKLGYNRENVSELKLEAAFRSVRFAEVDG